MSALSESPNKSKGKVLRLTKKNPTDLEFCREAFGFEAEKRGWFRERNRLFYFDDALDDHQAEELLSPPAPPSILDSPMSKLPNGPVKQNLMTMPDGLEVTWIRHPSALPDQCRTHWRRHTHLFVLENKALNFTANTSIFSYAHIEAADANFRFFGPGGIRWVDYADHEAAINDALDMSLAVAMKIQVVGAPYAGNKIAVIGDYANVGPALRSIFAAYERMGIIITSADLGLSIAQLKEWALPVAPTSLVPLGVFQKGVTSAQVTSLASFAGLHAMAECLDGSPALKNLKLSIQGIGEVGYHIAELLLIEGATLLITEANPQIRENFRNEYVDAFQRGQVAFIDDLNGIYDAAVDILIPCALRDILTETNLQRLKTAGVKMIGGPANNLFPDQIEGPWQYHNAGIPVVPYEGIGAGGVTGVAYSVMTGIFGKSPFSKQEKIDCIRRYVKKIMTWSSLYDLPAQVISDRILFRRAMRRRVLQQEQSDLLIQEMKSIFNYGDPELERIWVEDNTKRGFFLERDDFQKGVGLAFSNTLEEG